MKTELVAPAAFDSAGPITEIAVITAALLGPEIAGHLQCRLLAIVVAGGKAVKKIRINTGAELKAAFLTYDPPTYSVAGADDEQDVVAELERAIVKIQRGQA